MAPSCPITASVPNWVKQAQMPIINNVPLVALVDSGSSEIFIDYLFCNANHLQVERKQQKNGLIACLNEAETHAQVTGNLKCYKEYHENMQFQLLKDLCAEAILGQELMNLHSEVRINFRGQMYVCALSVSALPPPLLFN